MEIIQLFNYILTSSEESESYSDKESSMSNIL